MIHESNLTKSGYLLKIISHELKAKQEILLAIMKLALQMDISFAYPSISVYQSNEGENSTRGNFDSTSFIDDYQKTLSDSYDQT